MSIIRRLFLRSTTLIGAVTTSIAGPLAVEASPAEFTAIPTDIVDKIKAWQGAHRAAVRAAAAYRASLRVKPINRAECDRYWEAHVTAGAEVGPAREAMIMALWRVS